MIDDIFPDLAQEISGHTYPANHECPLLEVYIQNEALRAVVKAATTTQIISQLRDHPPDPRRC